MQRILIIGCGDIGRRVAARLRGRVKLYALSRSSRSDALIRAAGACPVRGDLDDARSLRRIRGIADLVMHLAPPPADGDRDTRTANLLAALGRAPILPQAILYISTTGVYGDCGGEPVPERRSLAPATARARRRVDAEQQLRAFGQRTGTRCVLLRVPGIWAADRLPVERLQKQMAAIHREEDSYTNHIHAEDLAAICLAALNGGRANRAYNACDDAPLKMGDWFDAVADAHQLPRPPRITRAEAAHTMPAMLWSFMNESRQVINQRLKTELKVTLRYPDAARAIREGDDV